MPSEAFENGSEVGLSLKTDGECDLDDRHLTVSQ
jgi:hypothetical protein